ncbi:hypothetical protein E2562_021019 [Oryza meyeriana var. granulata]|uniref:Uncharacterized protein n=1 Tax=Oryza meyeriana var. granulata TaxID=110450 RepID=A0A6G1FAH5_9ORYZ|nr:hypothetical protein E2562_021019 [Oryza meyeriana var. granulata]
MLGRPLPSCRRLPLTPQSASLPAAPFAASGTVILPPSPLPFIMACDNKGKRKVQEGKKVGSSSRSVRRRLDTSDDPAPTTDTSVSRPQRRSTCTSRICYNEARMGEPAPPEPSKPNPSESSDTTANDATANDATASDDTASDQI